MKVILNQTNFNILNPAVRKNNISYVKSNAPVNSDELAKPVMSLANFPNVSFKASPAMEFMMEHGSDICAYTKTLMIHPQKYEQVLQKLAKRPNAQSAINLLQGYQIYMHDVESVVFDILCEASYKAKRGFNDILKDEVPEALTRLKEKQKNILTKPNKIIDKLSEPVAEQVRLIRDEALEKMENDTFSRKSPLDKLMKVSVTGKDAQHLDKIYQIWYKLPSSSTDLDAFIVKNAKLDHFTVARHLLSPSVKTIDHIVAQSRHGSDSLANLAPVCADINNKKGSLTLERFNQLEPDVDITSNLQSYMDETIKRVNNSKDAFSRKPSYPIGFAKTILEDTNGQIVLNTDALRIPHNLAHQDEIFASRLEQKYTVKRRHG